MRNVSLVLFLIAIFGLTFAMADSYHGSHHHGGISSLYPGFHGLYGGHHSMHGLGGHGLYGGHHSMYGLGGYGMHGYGHSHHGYHHPIGHYGSPPTFIPIMGGHGKSHYGHIPYSPLISLLSHGMHGYH